MTVPKATEGTGHVSSSSGRAIAMMWLSSTPTERTFVSSRWLEFTGRSFDDERREGWLKGVHPDDAAELRAVLRKAASKNRGYSHEYRLRAHDGEYRRVYEEAEPYAQDQQEPRGFAGSTTELQELATDEETQRLQLKALNDIGPAIMGTDNEGRITIWNKRAEEIYGWSAEEVIGLNLADVRVPSASMSEAENAMAAIQAGRTWTGETAVRRRDGTMFLAHGTVGPMRDADGNIVGAIGVSEDISNWRTPQGPAARFGRLLDNSPNEIYIYDADTLRFLQVNRGALENLGYTDDEMLRFTPMDLRHDFTRETYLELLRPLRTGEAEQVTFETQQTRKDGTTYPVEARVSLARDEVPPVFVSMVEDISEEKAMREALERANRERDRTLHDLAEGRQRLEDLVENIPGVVWESRGALGTDSYRVTYVSRQIEGMLGYTMEQAQSALESDAFSIVHPDDRQAVLESAAETYQDGKPRTVRFRWIAADGHAVWIQSYFCAVKDESDKIDGLRGVNLDVTEQQRAEELLNFSIEAGRILGSSLDYQSTLRNVARLAVPRIADWCSVNVINESGELEQVSVAHMNPERVEWVRRMQGELRDAEAEQPVSGPRLVVKTGESQLAPEVTDEMIDRVVTDDRIRDVIRQLGMRSYMCVPMTRHGQVLGAMSFVSAESGHRFDEVDLRAAEHLARRAAAAIDNSMLYQEAERERARFTTIVASVDYGVCQVDAQGRIEHLNPAAESLLAGVSSELQGQVFHDLVHGAMEDGEPCDDEQCPVVAVLVHGQRCRSDATFANGRGGFVPVRVNCSPVMVAGHLLGAVVAFEDITERLESERRKDDFLAFATHELRNPLTPIVGLSRWLERHVNEDPERYEEDVRDVAETLAAEGSRMANIVDVFLDLSRIESDRLMLDPEPTDLCELTRAEAEAVMMRHDNVTVDMRIPAHECKAISDEARLRQVLSNLLENAAKYGGDNPKITVTLDPGDNDATIRVRDEGPGIPKEEQERVFDRFYRSASSGGKKGLGVGLFLTREIVGQLDGKIALDSEPGKGSEFRITLPYRPSTTRMLD